MVMISFVVVVFAVAVPVVVVTVPVVVAVVAVVIGAAGVTKVVQVRHECVQALLCCLFVSVYTIHISNYLSVFKLPRR